MKDINGKLEYKGKEYAVVFNLNVMEAIQEEYGTLDAWGALTDGKSGEVNAKALIFGLTQMINEGIDIRNEEVGTDEPMLTLKQVGRMITELGVQKSAETLNQTIIDSTQSAEKNA